MKVRQLPITMVILCGIFFSQTLFADCFRRCNPCVRICSQFETACQCTDPNAYNNPCIPPPIYCEAFGNVGYR